MNPQSNVTSRILAYLSFWVPMALVHAYVLFSSRVAATWTLALIYAVTYVTPAMLLGIPIISLCRRLIDRGVRGWKLILIHLGVAIVFSQLWEVMFYLYLRTRLTPEYVHVVIDQTWRWSLIYGTVCYGSLAGIVSTGWISRRLREREVAAARAESLRVRAEMQALRGQLDPHFLFNTLHSITALVRIDQARAEEALLQYGELMRRVLDLNREGTDEVTLEEELAFVDKCLALEKLRLGDRLKVETERSPEALRCYVPVFSVQPLVENAIRHAISPHRAGGKIRLICKVVDERLLVEISDDGPGADPGVVAQAKGTGLKVIRQRLQLRHGPQGSLKIATAQGKGFTVFLSMPVVTEPVLDTVA